MAAGCDYANARVHAMRSRLLGRGGIAALLAEPGLRARLEFLERTDYREAVAAAGGTSAQQLAAAERGLRKRLMDDLTLIDGFLAGERPRALFRSILAFEDGWTIKTVLRGIAASAAPERMLLLLAPTPELGQGALEELVRQREIKAVVDLLATWRSPYARPLVGALASGAHRFDLLHLEVPLDRLLFRRALEAAACGGEDGRVLRTLLETQIDLVNAATRAKLADQDGAEEFFIPGGRAMAPAGSRFYEPLAALRDPVAADHLLRGALKEAMRRETAQHPLSLAVPLSFVLDRRAEIQRIRLVLRGAEFGLPAGELLELVEV